MTRVETRAERNCYLGKIYDGITEELRQFIEEQPMFFVASAPLGGQGHVNLSPKGLDCFRIFDAHHVGYLDLTGSGNETTAHVTENGRITFMFCSFTRAPRILRLYGRGELALPGTEAWEALQGYFPTYPGTRQIIHATVHRVQSSCGFGVPLMEYGGQRDTMIRAAEAKGEDVLVAYRREKNHYSIDGLEAPL
jgi:hypothetical protein